MNKALEYLKEHSDFTWNEKTVREAIRIAYNEGLDEAIQLLEAHQERDPHNLINVVETIQLSRLRKAMEKLMI